MKFKKKKKSAKGRQLNNVPCTWQTWGSEWFIWRQRPGSKQLHCAITLGEGVSIHIYKMGIMTMFLTHRVIIMTEKDENHFTSCKEKKSFIQLWGESRVSIKRKLTSNDWVEVYSLIHTTNIFEPLLNIRQLARLWAPNSAQKQQAGLLPSSRVASSK